MPLPPDHAPPPYYRQLEEKLERQQRELADLRSLQATDNLSLQHQLGWLAGWVLAIGSKLGVEAKAVRPVHFDAPPRKVT